MPRSYKDYQGDLLDALIYSINNSTSLLRMENERVKTVNKLYFGRCTTVSYFYKCEYCGANLDPGELCDCAESKEERERWKFGNPLLTKTFQIPKEEDNE